MDSECKRFLISGCVQGVGFRYHTSQQAMKFGLTGYAKNLTNGQVEVVICGHSQKMVEMEQWLQNGPKTSSVESVESECIPYQLITDFDIL
ncbi:acylphosphatase [Vibrio sp. OCN044]|uniref:Acylphosphatase n=1 Tax=Vibrio tetraodonis subsp. pristinus TaxID=2695891 RepID=A0A6L8LRQ2_9VIBR|nr:acylphosphatase [Vibrio tetraodonis]MYM58465.1 acylphosphatase [Vibrio tetraodonis subsp. pristinus]